MEKERGQAITRKSFVQSEDSEPEDAERMDPKSLEGFGIDCPDWSHYFSFCPYFSPFPSTPILYPIFPSTPTLYPILFQSQKHCFDVLYMLYSLCNCLSRVKEYRGRKNTQKKRNNLFLKEEKTGVEKRLYHLEST